MDTVPIACDLTNAPDTPEERLAEYRWLFTHALVGRERTPDGGVRFRFRADDGVEDRIRELAAREKACCAFFDFAIAVDGNEVQWDATVVDASADHDAARAILDEFYALPDTIGDGVDGLEDRLRDKGLTFVENGKVKQLLR
jgi:hypothetical protein